MILRQFENFSELGGLKNSLDQEKQFIINGLREISCVKLKPIYLRIYVKINSCLERKYEGT